MMQSDSFLFQRLEQLAAVANLSEADRIAYDKAVDAYRISRTVEADCYEKGMQDGFGKGIREGMKEGARNIALRMKKQGLSDEDIAGLTGLPLEEINCL